VSPTVGRWLVNCTRFTYVSMMGAKVKKAPPDWIVNSLDRSEAQIAAGQTVPLEPVLDRLRAGIKRMQAGETAPKRSRPKA
jgi:hypothetical protein